MLTLNVNSSTLKIPEKGDNFATSIYSINMLIPAGQYTVKCTLNYLTTKNGPPPNDFTALAYCLYGDGYTSDSNFVPAYGIPQYTSEVIIGVYSSDGSKLNVISISATGKWTYSYSYSSSITYKYKQRYIQI